MKKIFAAVVTFCAFATLHAQTTPEAVLGMLPDFSPTESQIANYLAGYGDEGRIGDYVSQLSDAIKKCEAKTEETYSYSQADALKAAKQEQAISNAQLKAMGVSSPQELKNLSKAELQRRAIAAAKSGKAAQAAPKPTQKSKSEMLKAARKYSEKDRNTHEVLKKRLGVALDSLSKMNAHYETYWRTGGFAKRCSDTNDADKQNAIKKQYWTEVVKAYCPLIQRIMSLHKQLIAYDRLFDDYVAASSNMANQNLSKVGLTGSTAYMRALSYLNYAKSLVPTWELYD